MIVKTSVHAAHRLGESRRCVLMRLHHRVIGIVLGLWRLLDHLLMLWEPTVDERLLGRVIRVVLLSCCHTVLVEKDSIVLSVRLLLNHSAAAIASMIFEPTSAVIHLRFDHLRLISWHELLGMLVGICELAAALLVKILLWATITVRRWLPE